VGDWFPVAFLLNSIVFFRQIAISLNTGMFITDVRLSLFNAKWHTYLARNFKKKKREKLMKEKKELQLVKKIERRKKEEKLMWQTLQ